MRLLRAHISAFGKFQNQAFEFDKPFLSYREDNGYGKSTLVAFLTAMFYGLDTIGYKAPAKRIKERLHYLPFDGGNYGGSLTLEADGSTYVIERTFGAKSSTDDTIVLKKDGAKIDLPSEHLGTFFFGLDRDSFHKSILLDGDDVTVSSTGSIASKLEYDLDDTNDMNNFDSAYEKLDDAAKKYKAKRGSGGEINELSTRLFEVKGKIHNLESIEEALPGKYEEKSDLESRIRLDEEKHKAILSLSGVEANRKMLLQHEEEAKSSKASLQASKGLHPFGYPSLEELASLETLGQKHNDAKIVSEAKSLAPEEAATLDSLMMRFEKGVPEQPKIKDVEEKISQYLSLGKEETRVLDENKNRLLAKFKYREPKDEDIAHYEGELEKYKELGKKALSLPKTVLKKEERENDVVSSKPKGLLVGAFALSFALLGTGVALCFFALMVGIVLLILGVVSLGGSLYLLLSKTKSRVTSYVEVEKENPELSAIESERKEIEGNVAAFLAPFEYRRENGIEANFALFIQDYVRYKELEEERKAGEERKEASLKKAREIEKEVASFFASYGLEGKDFKALLETLRSSIPTYLALTKKKEEQDVSRKAESEAKAAYESAISTAQKKYRWAFASIEEVRSYDAALRQSQKDFEEKQARLSSFLKDHPELEGSQVAYDETAEQVDQRLSSLREQKSVLEASIKEDETRLEELDPLRMEEDGLTERLDRAKKEYDILSSAAKFLQEAKDAQNNKYLAPIRKSFGKYADALDSALGGKIEIDRSFKVSLLINGKSHDEGHLSSGQRSLVMFCLRLALLENMFPSETPFLILDDPFIHLDDAHMAALKEALPKMVKRWQVLYFCCSKSKEI